MPFAIQGECKKAFADIASFAQTAAAVRSARELRAPLVLGGGLLGRPAEERRDEELIATTAGTTKLCSSCNKLYQRELQCDGCACVFHWCCAGYDAEPCSDPFSSFIGVCVMLQCYCRQCLTRLEIAPRQIQEQQCDYLDLEHYFSKAGCEWRWIPCFSDGYTVFSVIWVALEGLRFLSSPFYCGIGTERDTLNSRKNADFLAFVSKCAAEVLDIIVLSPNMAEERDAWVKIKDYPEIAPKLKASQFDLACSAVCRLLESEMALTIRIWKFVDGDLSLGKSFEGDSDYSVPKQTMDILMWNTKVAPHFDLLLSHASADSETLDFAFLN